MSINLRLKQLREKKKLKKIQISSLMGVDNSQYTRIESGKLQPTLNHLMELNSKLGVDLNWLINGKGTMFNESYSEGVGMVVVNEPTAIYGDFQQEIIKLSKELEDTKQKFLESEIKRRYAEELLEKLTTGREGHHKKSNSA